VGETETWRGDRHQRLWPYTRSMCMWCLINKRWVVFEQLELKWERAPQKMSFLKELCPKSANCSRTLLESCWPVEGHEQDGQWQMPASESKKTWGPMMTLKIWAGWTGFPVLPPRPCSSTWIERWVDGQKKLISMQTCQVPDGKQVISHAKCRRLTIQGGKFTTY